jgi:hypothetical protein
VNFLDGTTVIGSGALSATSPFTATFSTGALAVGTHSITATYVGDGNFLTSTSNAVSQAVNMAITTTSLTSSVNPSVFGQSTTFTATVAAVSPGAGTPTGTVNFLDGATVIGSGTLSATLPFTATFSTAALSVATHSITATYLGDGNFLTSTSGPVSQVVNNPTVNNPPTITAPGTESATVGTTLSFTVTGADTLDPKENVTLTATGIPAGATFTSVPGNPATGTFSWTPSSGQGGLVVTVTFTATDNGSPAASRTAATVISVAPAPVSFFAGKLSWTHHLSLAKSGNMQTWTAKITNPNSITVYAQITIIGVDGTGIAGFTAQSAVITMTAGASLTPTISQSFTSTDIGTKFHFTATILWGTSPTALTNSGGNTKSGAFAVVA